ncbi:hypothetical protein V4U86_07980 [Mycobacterium sp. AMU20-3851]|uniref:hypothetical protein n=1 Tax=Mycobacterium sp. AMU20-3851 TaxID=3122055 RepID=UPI003754A8E6
MRTAVVRVDVDPSGRLTPAQLAEGMATLRELCMPIGAEVVAADLAEMPSNRREVEVLLAGEDGEALRAEVVTLCAKAFGEDVQPGVLTFVSRGTDDDAHGVLAGFGLAGEVNRFPSGQGWDIVEVTLDRGDLARVPESRIHTALEASLNSEVRILLR